MKFVEMTGKTLASVVTSDEIHAVDLRSARVEDHTIVRVNEQGDIEVRRPHKWDVIGGLLGEFEERIRQTTGLEWV
jgi:hypothetical protein